VNANIWIFVDIVAQLSVSANRSDSACDLNGRSFACHNKLHDRQGDSYLGVLFCRQTKVLLAASWTRSWGVRVHDAADYAMEMARGTGRRVNNSWLLFLVLVTFFFQIHFILGVELQQLCLDFLLGAARIRSRRTR
jgi:hypothetical protein